MVPLWCCSHLHRSLNLTCLSICTYIHLSIPLPIHPSLPPSVHASITCMLLPAEANLCQPLCNEPYTALAHGCWFARLIGSRMRWGPSQLKSSAAFHSRDPPKPKVETHKNSQKKNTRKPTFFTTPSTLNTAEAPQHHQARERTGIAEADGQREDARANPLQTANFRVFF